MKTRNDKKLIEKFIAWAVKRDMNQSAIAAAAGRSRTWASYLLSGQISRLNFDTRNRILAKLKERV